MNKKQKRLLWRIIIAAIFFVPLYLISEEFVKVDMPKWALLILFLIPYLLVGYDILKKALNGIRHGRVFDENFLMTVATVGAIVLGEYGEGVAVMLLYQIGELFRATPWANRGATSPSSWTSARITPISSRMTARPRPSTRTRWRSAASSS